MPIPTVSDICSKFTEPGNCCYPSESDARLAAVYTMCASVSEQAVTLPTRIATSVAGTTPAGAWSVSIMNVGVVDGLVQGVPIIPGQTVSYAGYYDDVTKQSRRLPAIDYDGTGTVLHITVQA